MKKKLINCLLLFILICSLFFTAFICYGRIKVEFVNNNQDLLGYRIYIDPGHGGKDNGASSNDVLEDEINLSISLKLLEELLYRGAIVEISRTGDYDLASLYASNRKREDLKKRAEAISLFNPDLFISIHINSYPSENVNGAQVFYRSNDLESKDASEHIQNQLNQLNKDDKKVKIADFYLFNHTKSNGVLIECGFITSSSDRKKLLSDSYKKQLVEKIGDGVANFIYAI